MSPFLEKFQFNSSLVGCIGVEREYFLVDPKGMPIPRSHQFLSVANDPAWTYELSACQVEHRTRPKYFTKDIASELAEGWHFGQSVAATISCGLAAIEVAHPDMPLDIYAYDERYVQIAQCIARTTLMAACRVAGTHIHVGMASLEEALEAANALRPHIEELVKLGDHSRGERIRLYREMAPQWMPPRYLTEHEFEATAREQGFIENPRNCWHVVRISAHGTVEVRVFGVTDDDAEVQRWISAVREIIASA